MYVFANAKIHVISFPQASHCSSYRIDFSSLSYSIRLSGGNSWFRTKTPTLASHSSLQSLVDKSGAEADVALLGKDSDRRQILYDVFGYVKPGQLCALMGNSYLPHTYIHIHTYRFRFIRAYIHTYIHMDIQVLPVQESQPYQTSFQVPNPIDITYIHTYIHTYIYSYIYTCPCL